MSRLLAGRYELLRRLGAGGQGTVHLAADLETEQLVAVKQCHVGRPTGATVTPATAALRHPAIVQVLDVVETPGDRWLVMEWVEGEDLGARIEREGTMPVPEALAVVAEIAEALSYLHGEALAHGDVKPSNVVGAVDGRAVLVDVGSLGSRHRSGAFSAPEPGREVSAAGDVWSLAATAVHLLVGSPPTIGSPILWPAAVPPVVASILIAALDLDPARRPPARDVAHAVRADGVTRPARLSVASPTLVGRAAELAWLTRAIGQGLVTLCGPRGVGKSALAREMARAAASASLGVVWVDGDELASMDDLCRELAARGGLAGTVGDLPTLIDALRERGLLVVIDGAGSIGKSLGRALASCELDGLALVVTSARPLSAPGELVLDVAPLDVPGGDSPGAVVASPASRLLLRRCRERQSLGPLDAGAAALLARAARASEGIPRVLELAAIDPRRAATHLERSLQPVVAELPHDLRRVLGALGTFRGPFTMADATAVLDASLPPAPSGWPEAIGEVRARSLVTGEVDGELRVVRAVREMAERAADPNDLGQARRSHAAWAQNLVDRLVEECGLRSPQGAVEVARRRRDLLAAVDTLLRVEPEQGGELLLTLAASFVDQGADSEVDRLFADAARCRPDIGRFLLWRARIAHQQGRLDDALVLLDEARSIGGDDETWRMIHRVTGHVHADGSEWEVAEDAYRAGLAAARRHGEPTRVSLQLVDVASVLGVVGRVDEARSFLDEAVALAQEAESPFHLVLALVQLATVLPDVALSDASETRAGRPATAAEALEAAAAVACRVASDALVALSHPSLAIVRLRLAHTAGGDPQGVRRAIEVAEEGRRASRSTASVRGLGISQLALALAAGVEGRLADQLAHLRSLRQIVGRPGLRPHVWPAYLTAVGLYACRRSWTDEAGELLALVDDHRASRGATRRPNYWDQVLRRRLAEAGVEPAIGRHALDPDALALRILSASPAVTGERPGS